MGNEGTSCGLSQMPQKKSFLDIQLKQVANGFIISGYGNIQTKIANTLPEALELIRKEFEI